MKDCHNSLKLLNTFAVDVHANQVIKIRSMCALLKCFERSRDNNESLLVLGEGSNVLFLDNYQGVVLLNRIKGIVITENKVQWRLHVGAGEKWHKLVMYTVNCGILGLENLAYIPGYVGAAPVQNIGAYGLELSQVCEYVDVLDLEKGNRIRFYCHECNFQYRTSIFKINLYKYVILFVGLRLYKKWRPILGYFKLNNLDIYSKTPRQILNTIINIRKKKFPNFIIHGNAGSFFKNPIINANIAYSLLKIYSNMPYYSQQNGKIKLLAGWLIENCNLKGYVLGEASVHYDQASIIINNRKKATGLEIAALALYIHNKVMDKFNIYLQPEVIFIGKTREIKLEELLKIE